MSSHWPINSGDPGHAATVEISSSSCDGEAQPLLGKPAAAAAADDLDEADPHRVTFLPAGGVAASVYTLCSMSLGVGVFVLPLILRDIGLVTGESESQPIGDRCAST